MSERKTNNITDRVTANQSKCSSGNNKAQQPRYDNYRAVPQGRYRNGKGRVFCLRQHTKQFFESLKETTVEALIESGMTEISRKRNGLPLFIKREGVDVEVRYFVRNLHADPKVFVYELQPSGLWRESFWILATPAEISCPVSVMSKGVTIVEGSDDPEATLLAGVVNGFALGKRPDGELIAKFGGDNAI